MLRTAEKPLVIAGGRAWQRRTGRFHPFCGEFQLPVATSWFHPSAVPECGRSSFNRAPHELLEAMKETDLLLVLGERIGPSMSQGYSFPRAPKPEQPMIHVWPSTEEVGRNYEPELGIGCDPHEFIKVMLDAGPGALPPSRADWVAPERGTSPNMVGHRFRLMTVWFLGTWSRRSTNVSQRMLL